MPSTNPPFSCVLCDEEIAARRWHVILTRVSALIGASPETRRAQAAAIVCSRCQDLPDAHTRLFPECAAAGYCDLYDHGHTLAADRASARAWLAQHGRIETPNPATKGMK